MRMKFNRIFSIVNRKRIFYTHSTEICMEKNWNCAFAATCDPKQISTHWNPWLRPSKRISKMQMNIWIWNHSTNMPTMRFSKTTSPNNNNEIKEIVFIWSANSDQLSRKISQRENVFEHLWAISWYRTNLNSYLNTTCRSSDDFWQQSDQINFRFVDRNGAIFGYL